MATASARRRTQQERRETTRNALLEATIQCLVERGYASTTTRAVSKRAGVSPGALQHHFTSKEELIADAIGYLAGELTAQLIEQGVPSASSRRHLTEQLVDYLWRTLNGPLMAAATELGVAGRTDPLLRERLVDAQRQALEGVPLAAGPPLLALWVGSRVQRHSEATMTGIAAVAIVLAVLCFLLLRLLRMLGAQYDRLVGASPTVRTHVNWLRSMRGERPEYKGVAPTLT